MGVFRRKRGLKKTIEGSGSFASSHGAGDNIAPPHNNLNSCDAESIGDELAEEDQFFLMVPERKLGVHKSKATTPSRSQKGKGTESDELSTVSSLTNEDVRHVTTKESKGESQNSTSQQNASHNSNAEKSNKSNKSIKSNHSPWERVCCSLTQETGQTEDTNSLVHQKGDSKSTPPTICCQKAKCGTIENTLIKAKKCKSGTKDTSKVRRDASLFDDLEDETVDDADTGDVLPGVQKGTKESNGAKKRLFRLPKLSPFGKIKQIKNIGSIGSFRSKKKKKNVKVCDDPSIS